MVEKQTVSSSFAVPGFAMVSHHAGLSFLTVLKAGTLSIQCGHVDHYPYDPGGTYNSDELRRRDKYGSDPEVSSSRHDQPHHLHDARESFL
jgi:hypothetical protein